MSEKMLTSASRTKQLGFTMEKQKKPVWCWAAVGASCALFYDPESGWTQCKVASRSIQPPPGDCCGDSAPDKCNCIWYLDNPNHLGSFETTGIHNGYQAGAIPFGKLTAEIDAGHMVAFRMQIEGMFHFVVISGYEISTDENSVTVNDPFFGDSRIPYPEFETKYRSSGSVTHTFFSKPVS